MGNQNINLEMKQGFNPEINMMMPNTQEELKSIIFETRLGNKTTITLPMSFTVGQAIEKYYERCPQLNLIRNKIFFLYSSFKINERDKTKKIYDFFKEYTPKVLVIDVESFIGG